jgi:eukaryotic-like serine/threonine-protein kinase
MMTTDATDTNKDANIGRVLQNRYRLIRQLGQGSMGRVYAAEDEALGGVPVAVKFLSQTLLNRKMRDRFEREAKTCAQLGQRSIHIVRVTDYGVDEDGIPFYVMEHLRGDSLLEVVGKVPLPLPRFLQLARQVCLGLQCAHQGIKIEGETYPIVHRDIKPSNILVTQNETFGELAKILDFGIAKVLQSESSQTGCFMGTLAYSSPEQMEGHELDGRSDIYSLGVMMFQMLTGRMPLYANTHSFGGWYKTHHFQEPKTFEQANPNVRLPKLLEGLVLSCLSKSSSDRPQTVGEIIEAFHPLEERYGAGRQVAQRISASLSKLAVAPDKADPAELSADEVCRIATWPGNMPIAEIVFPKPTVSKDGKFASLWVMLPQREIDKRRTCTRYNQFLFLEAPHPMLLWLTVLYNREHGPRWMPCYLDLQSNPGRNIARLLSETGQYRVLFFAQENPQRCSNVQTVTVASAQCKLLQDWANVGQLFKAAPNPGLSKDYLKGALEEIKPKILTKLEAIYGAGENVAG